MFLAKSLRVHALASAFCAAALAVAPAFAFAQQTPLTPPSPDSGRLDQPPLSPAAPIDDIGAATGADGLVLIETGPGEIEKRLPDGLDAETEVAAPLLPPPPLRDGAPNSFVLIAVDITGSTVIAPSRFAPLYDDLLALPVTRDDVEDLVAKITALYHSEGYFLARAVAPPQTMADGVLRIEIAEGYVADVQITGEATRGMRDRLQKLRDERPLRLSTLERTLALIEDMNGVTVRSAKIEPDAGGGGAHRLVVDTSMQRIDGVLYTDNRGTEEAGPLQAFARIGANMLLMTGDRLSLSGFFTPEDPTELALAELSYQLPLTGDGLMATATASWSHFDAGASLAALDTEVTTKKLALALSYPVLRSRRQSLWLNLGVEGRDIEETRLGATQYNDKLRTVALSANYRKTHPGGLTTLFARATQGLDAIDPSGTAPLSRPDADGVFTKFDFLATRSQKISGPFSVYAAAGGQVSMDPLLASEEFSVGGSRFGRAYDYSELNGEDGVAALGELRFTQKPALAFIEQLQVYLFADYGAVWNDNAAPGFEKLTLASAGAGLRLVLPEAVNVSLEAARPLNRTPLTQDDRDWRGFFSLSKTF